MSNRPFCMLVRAVCWLVGAVVAAETFLLVIDANGEADDVDETDSCFVTFESIVVWLMQVLEIGGDVSKGGGEDAIMPECESIVEWEFGLMMRSETVEADEESMLMVLFEFDGDNCCIWLVNGL